MIKYIGLFLSFSLYGATLSTNLQSVKQNDFTIVSNSLLSSVLTNYIKAGTNISIVKTSTNIVINATASATTNGGGTNTIIIVTNNLCTGTNFTLSSVSPSVIAEDYGDYPDPFLVIKGCNIPRGASVYVDGNTTSMYYTNSADHTTIAAIWLGLVGVGTWDITVSNSSGASYTLTNALTVTPSDSGIVNLMQTNNSIFTGVNTFSNLNGNGAGLFGIPITSITAPSAVLTNGASFPVTFSNAVTVYGPWSFTDPPAGSGSSLTNLNASELRSGTVNNERLSGVALLDGTNVFTGTNTFSKIAGTIACAGTITTSSTLASSGGNVRGAEFQPYSASANTIISLRDNTKLIAFRNTGSNVVTITGSGDIAAQGSITVSNGSIVTSNSWVNVPTLANGQNFYCSSNGVPHVIWSDEAGTLHTNRLVP